MPIHDEWGDDFYSHVADKMEAEFYQQKDMISDFDDQFDTQAVDLAKVEFHAWQTVASKLVAPKDGSTAILLGMFSMYYGLYFMLC